MRYFIRLLGLCLSLSLPSLVAAQTLDDALRFSETQTLGTARSLGTANSMGAIGAEWTAVQSNPAGLAAFRRNEFSISLAGIQSNTTEGQLAAFVDGEVQESSTFGEDGKFRLALPQLALVFTKQPIGSRWSQINFGFGVSQTKRQEESIIFQGFSSGSITDRFLETSNNFFQGGENGPFLPDELLAFDERLAYDTEALFELDEPTEFARYSTDYDLNGRVNDSDAGEPIQKIGDVRRRGYNAGFDISVAGNYAERLLVGATLGIVNSSFDEINVYEESDPNDRVFGFEELNFTQNTITNSTGITGRVGAIYRFSQALRLGVAYHTPTLNFIDQSYGSSFTYRFIQNQEAQQATAESPEARELEYRFRSPGQLKLSLASVIGRRGFLSAEVGYTNYTQGNFKIDEEFEDLNNPLAPELNGLIDTTYRSAFQFRIGGELNLNPVQVRLGYENIGTPLAEVNGQLEAATQGYSAGVGYRKNRLSFDLGYRLTTSSDRVYRPYTTFIIVPQPEVTYTPVLHTGVLTVGYKLTRD